MAERKETAAPKIALAFAVTALVATAAALIILSSDDVERPDWLAGLLAALALLVAAPTALVAGGVGLARANDDRDKAMAGVAALVGLAIIAVYIVSGVQLAQEDR